MTPGIAPPPLPPTILPGSTIGFLGGGQLGRMAGLAARSMGYDVQVLDPDPRCPAAAVASRLITAGYDDASAAAELARGCSVVTLEIEQISRETLKSAARHALVYPGADVVWLIQDRLRQKKWLSYNRFPLGAYSNVTSSAECEEAVRALGSAVVKARFGGYDGRGQVHAHDAPRARAAWDAIGGRPAVVERFLDIKLELSVLVARRADGALVAYAPAVNHHTDGVLTWSALPGALPRGVATKAKSLARRIASVLDLVGLLAVEFFLLTDGSLLVNELAPRPHNSYHASERACVTGQFEQLVRAICGLPLGAVKVVRPAAIVNLLGDLWPGGEAPDLAEALAVDGVRLHLYGKTDPRPGRKMGHLSGVGATADEALASVLRAYERLSPEIASVQALAALR